MEGSNLLFIQLAVVLGLAASLGFAVKQLRLPLIVAYLLTGVLLSFLQILNSQFFQLLNFLPDIGIAFVLFFIGMELDLKELKMLGKPIALASLGQIIIGFTTGFLIATALGFNGTVSFYLGVGLSFSSTIVAVKALLDKKEVGSLYGKLSVGILLIEDLVAILVLMGMAILGSGGVFGAGDGLVISEFLLKAALLLVLTFWLSRYVLKKVFTAVAGSSELLFLSALAWFFIFVAVALSIGLSAVIGAFLSGVALANSPFHFEVQGKVKPLRDFFVTLFFVYLGTRVSLAQLGQTWPIIALFTLYALALKPLVYLLILGVFGFRKHTIFNTAIHLSQISEFSLIIMLMGQRLGILPDSALSVMALTGVISITVSSVELALSRRLYQKLNPFLGLFESKGTFSTAEKRQKEMELEEHVILIGAHRIGGEIIRFLKREGIPFLVLDFNPEVVQRLIREKIATFYGDLGDPEILDFLNLEKAKLIISTATDVDDNLLLLSEVARRKLKAVVIVRAGSAAEVKELYGAGADYVILPEVVSGDFVAQILRAHWPSMDFFKNRADIELEKLSRNQLAFE